MYRLYVRGVPYPRHVESDQGETSWYGWLIHPIVKTEDVRIQDLLEEDDGERI